MICLLFEDRQIKPTTGVKQLLNEKPIQNITQTLLKVFNIFMEYIRFLSLNAEFVQT
jgi:hypothetical protein